MHFAALPCRTLAVAVALISCVVIPTSVPKNDGSGLPRATVRYTSAFTHTSSEPSGHPPDGPPGRRIVTSVVTLFEGDTPNTLFASAAACADCFPGPASVKSVLLSNDRAMAPASAEASAEFCAWRRDIQNTP